MSVLKRWNGETWEIIGPTIKQQSSSLIIDSEGIVSILQENNETNELIEETSNN